MSQIASTVHDLAPISIPFVKFSHNTSPIGCRNFIWNHIGQRDDLKMVVQNSSVIDERGNYATRIMLKITTDVDVLEIQDLGELVSFSREYNNSSGAEHPVQVVVKCPFMAMKYPKSLNSVSPDARQSDQPAPLLFPVRRIQLKFKIEPDFSKAVSILTQLGFPITESGSNSTPVARPSISPIYPPLSSTSSLTLARNPANSEFTARNPSAKSNFMIPVRPDTRNSEPPTPISMLSFDSNSFSRPASASTISISAPTPSSFSNLKSFSPHDSTISEVPPPYTTQFQRGPEEASDTALRAVQTVPALENALYQSQHQPQQQGISDHIQVQDGPLGTSRFFAHPLSATLNSTSAQPEPQSRFMSQPIGLVHREEPETGPIPSYDDELPPRRELPFPKLREDNRCSSAPNLTHLTKPTPVEKADPPEKAATQSNSTPAPKPSKKRVAQRKHAVKKAPEPKPPVKTHTEMSSVIQAGLSRGRNGQEDEPSPLAAKSNVARPASASGLQTKATAAKKRTAPARPPANTKKPKMVDQSTQTQTLSGRDHTSALAMSSSNETPTSIDEAPSPPPPKEYVDLIDAFITAHRSAPAPGELWERPGYAEADEEQRLVMLNDFICENLDDPEFLQLCADTEKAWRRIGLGM